VRHQLQQQGLPVDEAPADDEVRETYNFPPGAYGLVYRADIPDQGVQDEDNAPTEAASLPVVDEARNEEHTTTEVSQKQPKTYKYELKAMKWGLIPFWTKRSPDYGSMMRTINCRDDSLIENRGMWNTMKQRKRCLVIAQGFYEWLKTGPGGKEKRPHFVKRKDGQLMCFAGLWDCVKYEDSEEKMYTYTVITTDSNKQLSFLHDRMPVILEPGSEGMKMWLDPTRNKWSKELQLLLKPFAGELDCYPVNQEVGKVGNNSPDFIIPIDSKDNKKNIANFFGNARKAKEVATEVQHDKEENRATKDIPRTEDNAPLPVPVESTENISSKKRSHSPDAEAKSVKVTKLDTTPRKGLATVKAISNKKPRSAVSNEAVTKKASPVKKEAGTQRITNFFNK